MKSLLLSIGYRTLLLYLGLTYFGQFVLHFVFPEFLGEMYKVQPGGYIYALLIPVFVFVVIALDLTIPDRAYLFRKIGIFGRKIFNSNINFIIGFTLIGFGVHFISNYGIGFRHSGVRISDAGPIVGILFALKPYIVSWLFFQVLDILTNEKNKLRSLMRLQAGIYCLGLALGVTGSLDILPVTWALVLCIFKPETIRNFIVSEVRAKTISAWRIITPFSVWIILGVILAGAISIGIFNKQGFKEGVDRIDNEGAVHISISTIVRLSSSYASFITVAEKHILDTELTATVYSNIIEMVPYRLSLILEPGNPLPRPDVTSISRLNYLTVHFYDYHDRAGMSPGLMASAVYAGPFPLGFMLMGLYVVVISRLINYACKMKKLQPSWLIAIVIVSFVFVLFESPVDYLNFVDPSLLRITLIPLALVSVGCKHALPLNPLGVTKRQNLIH